MKKLLFVLLPVLVAMASCLNDSYDTGAGADEKEVGLVIYAPGMTTRAAIDGENTVERLDLLVFDGAGDKGKFLYRRYAWRNTNANNGFKTTLKLGKGLTIYFAANAKEVLDDVPYGLLDEGSKAEWSQIKEYLIITSPADINYTDGLPMWGVKDNCSIEDQPVNNLGIVNLLRSVASADFKLEDDALTQFRLDELHVVYAADKGFLHYDPLQVSGSGNSLTANYPVSPLDMQTTVDWFFPITGGATSVENKIYIFENDSPLPSITPTKRQTKLVMKGQWLDAGGQGYPTYYPIAFREVQLGQATRIEVIRNVKYMISVTGVNGDGYDSLEDAKLGEEINFEYETIKWKEFDDGEIIVQGNMFVSIERKYASVQKKAGDEDHIYFSTNYDIPNIRMSNTKGVVGLPGENNQHIFLLDETTQEQFCRVRLLDRGAGGFVFSFFAETSIPDTDTDPDHYKQGTLYVRIGMIDFEIVVRQHNITRDDWNNIGGIPYPW